MNREEATSVLEQVEDDEERSNLTVMLKIIDSLELLKEKTDDETIELVGKELKLIAMDNPANFIRASKDLIKINREVLPLLMPIIKTSLTDNLNLMEPAE